LLIPLCAKTASFPHFGRQSTGASQQKNVPDDANRGSRKSTMTFESGKPVFILDDPQGTPWLMQAYADIIDPNLSYDQLEKLGDKLKPAPGWKFRV
jgi:hypothetical protein